VANIEAFPELLPHLPIPPLRTWWFLELIDVRSRINEDETLLGALSFFENHPDWLGGFGLSPHAPYTASVDLYRLARSCGEKYGMLCTTHIAESVDEHQMFSYASGPLYDFLAGLGRDNSDCGQGSALSHLVEHGVIGPNCIIAHLNYLQDYDYELVARSGASVVHCPKCHTYFGHAPFPLKTLREHGVNVCLGTDSLASNNTLDMRSEMREAQTVHGLSDREVLEMLLLNGARALGQTGKLGQISPGSMADLVAFPHAMNAPNLDPYRRVVQSHEEPNLLLVNGCQVDFREGKLLQREVIREEAV
jgi:cytosine/adenosine deaminase-related metal-dependent hydrolase